MRDSQKRQHCDDLHQLRFESVFVQLPRNRICKEVAVSLLMKINSPKIARTQTTGSNVGVRWSR